MKKLFLLPILVIGLLFIQCEQATGKEPITKEKTEITPLDSSLDIQKINEPKTKIITKNEPNEKPVQENIAEPSQKKKVEVKKPKSKETKKSQPIVETPKKEIEKKKASVIVPPPSTKKIDQKPVEKSQPTVEVPKKEIEKKVVSIDHNSWDQLLRQFVSSSGKVNYEGFKSQESKLDSYLSYLENNPENSDWSKAEKMAYYINAYNAFTVKLILKNYPLTSITDLHGGKPWDEKWIKLGDKTYSLNNIENDILRPRYKDARIHFAVNCAAKSCPPLLNRAWTAGNLNANFEKQAKAFINNTAMNAIGENEVKLSKIFEWYKEDFGDLVAFLNKYSNTKIDSNAAISYMEYNWKLNK